MMAWNGEPSPLSLLATIGASAASEEVDISSGECDRTGEENCSRDAVGVEYGL